MTRKRPPGPATDKEQTLEIRRIVGSSPARVFAAWTDPDQLRRWWGPPGVVCPAAEVDLRVGGRYRIGNRFADGTTLWIVGEFEVVSPPRELVYTWRLEPGPPRIERVKVRFEPREGGTEVVVVHERIPDAGVREQHERGWLGCLGRLAEHFGAGPFRAR